MRKQTSSPLGNQHCINTAELWAESSRYFQSESAGPYHVSRCAAQSAPSPRALSALRAAAARTQASSMAAPVPEDIVEVVEQLNG